MLSQYRRHGQPAWLDDTLYSFGTACCFNDFYRPVGWRLTDGEAWDAIQSESAFFGFGGVLDLAASDTALVVSTSYGLGATSRVWRWTSDTSWVETNLMASDRDLHSVNDIAWTAGSFLAVGTPNAYGDSVPAPGVVLVRWADVDPCHRAGRRRPSVLGQRHQRRIHRARRDGRGDGRLDRVGPVEELGLVRTLLGRLPRFAIRPICASHAGSSNSMTGSSPSEPARTAP